MQSSIDHLPQCPTKLLWLLEPPRRPLVCKTRLRFTIRFSIGFGPQSCSSFRHGFAAPCRRFCGLCFAFRQLSFGVVQLFLPRNTLRATRLQRLVFAGSNRFAIVAATLDPRMSEDLFEFLWQVSDAGYKWVTTKSIDQPEPPEPLGLEATEQEKLSFANQELASRPRQFLTDGVPAGHRNESARWTRPLKDFAFRLHRRFAEAEPSADGALKFANSFGLLGSDADSTIPLPTNDESVSLLGAGEDLGIWVSEIRAMADAVAVWDLVLAGDLEGLSGCIEWQEHGVLAHWPRGRLQVVGSEKIRPTIFSALEPGNVIEAAKVAVQLAVNDHLSKKSRATPRLLYNVDSKAQELHIVPNGLIGAIWLDFALAIEGKRPYRKCPMCGEAFPANSKGQRRKFCSNRCKVAHHRQKKPQEVSS